MDSEQKISHGFPWDLREEMGNELWNKIENHPNKGEWQKRRMGWMLMVNSISHPVREEALRMISEDIERGYTLHVPTDVLQFAVQQAVEWRDILLKTQPGKNKVEGKITLDNIQKRLADKLPTDYLTKLMTPAPQRQ